MANLEKELDDLHTNLALQLQEAIKPEPVVVDGEVVGKRFNAAALREARQFLLDNKITSTLDKKPLKDLVDTLPTFDGESAFQPGVQYS